MHKFAPPQGRTYTNSRPSWKTPQWRTYSQQGANLGRFAARCMIMTLHDTVCDDLLDDFTTLGIQTRACDEVSQGMCRDSVTTFHSTRHFMRAYDRGNPILSRRFLGWPDYHRLRQSLGEQEIPFPQPRPHGQDEPVILGSWLRLLCLARFSSGNWLLFAHSVKTWVWVSMLVSHVSRKAP